ncbi:MAG: NnrS family protein [Gammaproteobacteria bacterium]|nr:NnrS family protein [Gammaproteobacteria bacterium]
MTNSDTPYKYALLHLGFRPFFLGAATAAILLVLIWMLIYQFAWSVDLNGLPPIYWHAHEMVFGYGLAIIAGFLLTAAKTWTNLQTLHGYKLLALFSLWLIGRIVPFAGAVLPVAVMAVTDSLFVLILLIHISILILKSKQYRQLIILVLLLLLLAGNLLFYTGVLQNNPALMQKGIYMGLYLLINIILVMGGRVIPFFIERGVGYPVKLTTRRWLDIAGIAFFALYWIIEVFTPLQQYNAITAAVLLVLHGWRLWGWYTPGIWRKPLLWVLYIAYGMLVIGFLLRAATGVFDISPVLATHAFGYGGVGVLTLGMMCRIIWGHTGREIANPPRALPLIFTPIILGAIVRSIMPILLPDSYQLLVGLSQVLWMLAFGVFLFIYAPVLIAPRVDGKYG